MRIAIIGAGLAGLSCALECERLGVYPDVFERGSTVGWIWPSVIYWPSVFFREQGDILKYLRENCNISLTPSEIAKGFVMKSPNKNVKVTGNSGYFLIRGKGLESIENQLLRKIYRTRIQYNNPANHKELSKQYDYVVVSSGRAVEAMDLGVWKAIDNVVILGGVAVGNFNPTSSTIYFNTKYADVGYARVTPFNPFKAIVGIYIMGEKAKDEFNAERLFDKFLKYEKLDNLEFIYKIKPPLFPVGKVKKFQVGNVLLAGRSAGLTDRLIGVGGPGAIMSGVLAARAIIQGKDYNKLVRPLQRHIENVSSFRNIVNKFNNNDFDNLLTSLDNPMVKTIVYNSKINFIDMAGSVLKMIYK